MIAVDAPRLAASLLAIAQAVNETDDLGESLRRVCRELARLTGAETVSAHLRDPATNVLRPFAGYHMPKDLLGVLSTIELPLAEEGFAADVFHRETVVWSDDVAHDPRFASPLFRRFPHQSGVIVPLVLGDEAAGAFYLVWWTQRVRLDPPDLALLQAVARQVGTLLRLAHLTQVATRRAERMRALAEMEGLVSGTLDRQLVAQRIADTLRHLLGATATLVHVRDESGGHLELLAVSGTAGHAVRPGDALPRGTGMVGLAIEERRLIMTADVLTDPRATFPPEIRAGVETGGYRAVLACPLVAHGRVIGGLGVGDHAGRVFGEEDVQLVQAFADQAAVALWNASLFAAERAAHAEAERALGAVREREARLQALVDDSPVGVLIHQESVIAFANAALVDMTGYGSADELIGQPYWVLLAPGERERIEAQRQAMLRGELAPRRQEVENLRKDGTPFWVENWASAVTWQGAPARLVTFVDITERKRAQAAVAEREAQLRQTMKMEAIGKLAGGVAHDFNNVLAVIMGYADLLRDQLPADAALREPVDAISVAAQRAARLTRQLLAFSRKQVLKPQVLDLNETLSGLEQMLRRVIGEDVQLVTRLDPGLGRIEADVGQLEQVVMNLVVNARDAMPTGGRLLVATANATLDEVRAGALEVPGGPYVELTVQDSGVGMDATVLAHLFEPFFTTKGPGQGTGLGLSTAYGIVRQSGGAVAVESRPGQGATFRLYFPRAAGDVTEAPPPAAPRAGGGAGETLLVVEDDPEVRALVCAVLQRAGYHILEARDGVEALALARAHRGPIDAVITDVIMPRMGGDQLVRHLTEARPGTPVLYMSGYTDDALGLRDVLRPGVSLLPKPFSVEGLLRAVREVLHH